MYVPRTSACFAARLAVILLQLLGYYVSAAKAMLSHILFGMQMKQVKNGETQTKGKIKLQTMGKYSIIHISFVQFSTNILRKVRNK